MDNSTYPDYLITGIEKKVVEKIEAVTIHGDTISVEIDRSDLRYTFFFTSKDGESASAARPEHYINKVSIWNEIETQYHSFRAELMSDKEF